MASDTDLPADRSDQTGEKLCDICLSSIRKSCKKCVNNKCSVRLHTKCFEQVAKLFLTTIRDWKYMYDAQGENNQVTLQTNSDEEEIISNLRTQAWVENQDFFPVACEGAASFPHQNLIQDMQRVHLNAQSSTSNTSLIRIDSNNSEFVEDFESKIIQTTIQR
ncbi:unnamed protein product [Psylliodes chrysocephalus]|uniref:Uncharacterized protein n=1 Tax=Psylliodes chrysocephalus TaxID=3402493 RepID=A0A9P0D0B9_9CUCU|nr:unnamed protein product [Psylliodes chrysocephala]